VTNRDYTIELIGRGWIRPTGEPVYPREPRPGLLEFCEWPLLTLAPDDRLNVTWRVGSA
jgi:hypothetical protein